MSATARTECVIPCHDPEGNVRFIRDGRHVALREGPFATIAEAVVIQITRGDVSFDVIVSCSDLRAAVGFIA